MTLPSGQAAANKRAYNNKWRAENRQRVRDLEKARRLANPEPFKAAKKKYYDSHKEKVLGYAADYRDKNSDVIKERAKGKHAKYSATYRAKDPAKSNERSKKWKLQNPEKHKEYCAKWTKENPELNRIKEHKRRARKVAAGGEISKGITERLMTLQKGKCACCNDPLGDDYELDHIVPLALGGSNSDCNIQLLKKFCNRSKGAKHPIAYMQSRGRLL